MSLKIFESKKYNILNLPESLSKIPKTRQKKSYDTKFY